MALDAKAVTANAAIAAAELTIDDYLDGLNTGSRVIIVPSREWVGVAYGSLPWAQACTGTGAAAANRFVYVIPGGAGDSNIRWGFNLPHGGFLPLSFRFTNDAGELS